MRQFFLIITTIGLLAALDRALEMLFANAEFTTMGVLWLLLATVGALGLQGEKVK